MRDGEFVGLWGLSLPCFHDCLCMEVSVLNWRTLLLQSKWDFWAFMEEGNKNTFPNQSLYSVTQLVPAGSLIFVKQSCLWVAKGWETVHSACGHFLLEGSISIPVTAVRVVLTVHGDSWSSDGNKSRRQNHRGLLLGPVPLTLLPTEYQMEECKLSIEQRVGEVWALAGAEPNQSNPSPFMLEPRSCCRNQAERTGSSCAILK